MLVLSRRLNEKVVLPGIGTTVQVVAVKGNTVRLGIDAPPDVRVIRAELHVATRPVPSLGDQPAKPTATRRPSRFRRAVSGRLKTVGIHLGLARLQLQTGLTDHAVLSLEQLHKQIQQLRRRIDRACPAARPRPLPWRVAPRSKPDARLRGPALPTQEWQPVSLAANPA